MSPTPPTRLQRRKPRNTKRNQEERGRTRLSRPLGRSLRVPVDNPPQHVDDGHWDCELVIGHAGKTTAAEPAPLNHSFVVPHPSPACSRAAAGLSPESTSPNTPTELPPHEPIPTARIKGAGHPAGAQERRRVQWRAHWSYRHVDASLPHASRLHLDSSAPDRETESLTRARPCSLTLVHTRSYQGGAL